MKPASAPSTQAILPTGRPWPLGVERIELKDAFNFVLYSRHATGVMLLCYAENDPVKLVCEFCFEHPAHKTGSIWHCRIPAGELRGATLYACRVLVAERPIPARDASEQISTPGYESSGTSNMKFMMNGALTIGTRDGATIEMAGATGEENFFSIGLSAEQVAQSRNSYSPQWHYGNDPETRATLDLIAGNHFSPNEPGVFVPILDAPLRNGDHSLHLADLKSYGEAHARLGELYADEEGWARKAILNIAASGRFSSDRTIAEYAKEIWGAAPCPLD